MLRLSQGFRHAPFVLVDWFPVEWPGSPMRDDEALVTIAEFETVWEASIARGALRAAGIRALVPEETLVGSQIPGKAS